MARSKKAKAAADYAMSIDVTADQAGLGVDIVEISKMRKILERTPTFSQRTFTDAERHYCDAKADPAMSYAARFAAKEAVVKALGCGFSEGVGLKDVEVAMDEDGRPIARLHGRAKEIFEEKGIKEMPISLSHTSTDAIACAIAIVQSHISRPEKKVDSMTELARNFKEARAMLDDLGDSDSQDMEN